LVSLITAQAQAEVSFLREIAPLLTTRCTGCHGDKKAEGDYRLHTYRFLLEAGSSEEPAIVPGKPDASVLLARLRETDASVRMPQDDDPFTPQQIDLVRRWIAEGAKFDGADPATSYKSQMPPREHPAAPERYVHAAPVYALAFSPDGRELAVGGHHEVTIWDPATGRLLRRLGKLPLRIQSLAYNRAGTQLLVGGGSPGDYGEILLVDTTGQQAPRSIGVCDDVVLGVAWSRHEQWIAAASADRSVKCWDAASGKLRFESRLHSDWATAVSFSRDDRFLASSSRDCTVKVLEAATGRLFTTFNGHQMQYGPEAGRFEVFDVLFSADDDRAFSLGEGRALRVWEPEKVKAESGDARDMEARFMKGSHTQFLPHASRRPAYQVAATSSHVLVATGDGPVKDFDLKTGQVAREFSGHAGWVFSLDVHDKTDRIAAGAFNGEVRIWNRSTGEAIARFLASPGNTATAARQP
jgi:WD40 repeat protein